MPPSPEGMFKGALLPRDRPVGQLENDRQYPGLIPTPPLNTPAGSQQAPRYPPLPILHNQAWKGVWPLLYESSDDFRLQRCNAVSYPSEMETEDDSTLPHVSEEASICQDLGGIANPTVIAQYADSNLGLGRQLDEEWNSFSGPTKRPHGSLPFRMHPGIQASQTLPRPFTAPSNPFTTRPQPSTALTDCPYTTDASSPPTSGNHSPLRRPSIEGKQSIGLTAGRTEFSRPMRRTVCAPCRRRKKPCSLNSNGNWPCDLCKATEEASKDKTKKEASKVKFKASECCFTEATSEYEDYVLFHPRNKGYNAWQVKRYEKQKARTERKELEEWEMDIDDPYDDDEGDDIL